MKIKKYLRIPLLLALLLMLFFGCSLKPDNTDQTAANLNTEVNANTNQISENEEEKINTNNWLTYTNEEYGFSFRYPISVIIDNISNEDGYIYSVEAVTKEQDPVMKRGHAIFSISIANNPQVLESETNSYSGVKKQNIKINNKTATQYTYYQGMEETESKSHNARRIFVEYNDVTFIVNQANYAINSEYDIWFNDIVDSLYFF